MAFPNLRPEVVAGYLACSERVFAEVLHGELFIRPSPGIRHQLTVGGLIRRRRDTPGWETIYGVELHLGPRPDIIVPDLSGWKNDRLSDEDYPTVAPDWVCEIFSGGTEHRDRTVKPPIYAEHGVSHLWLVDPTARTLEAFALDCGVYRPRGIWRGDVLARIEPFDALELDLTVLWEW